ncbi:MAG: hypothetical protein ACO1HP_00360 [Bacteroidota bacterium]
MKAIAIILGFVLMVGIAADYTAPPPQIYQYTWTTDTLTDTEGDTLTGVTLYYDLWNYNYSCTATQLSGSTNIIHILQENNFTSGNTGSWYEVERDTLVGAGTQRLYGGSNLYPSLIKGVRQRVIVKGIGTQSSRYTLKGTFKKTS